jgi:hypothetical protein
MSVRQKKVFNPNLIKRFLEITINLRVYEDMAFSHPAPHWSPNSLAHNWRTLPVTWRTLDRLLADSWHPLGVSSSPYHVVRDGNSSDFGEQFCQLGRVGGGLGSHLAARPPGFLPLSPY